MVNRVIGVILIERGRDAAISLRLAGVVTVIP
jgi:hypothetical protein